MRTVAVAVSANRDFACSHGYTVATLLPQTQGKMRQNGVFRVCMSQTEKGAKSADLTYENDLFRGCAPGVTRTPDPRIRNPLLYPAELRAQIWTSAISLRKGAKIQSYRRGIAKLSAASSNFINERMSIWIFFVLVFVIVDAVGFSSACIYRVK